MVGFLLLFHNSCFTQVFNVDLFFFSTQAELHKSLCMNTGVCYDVRLLKLTIWSQLRSVSLSELRTVDVTW